MSYPCLSRGVDGGVHGELPSETDPCIAVWRFRTAFNKLIVELLKLCLNDYRIEWFLLIEKEHIDKAYRHTTATHFSKIDITKQVT